MCVIGLDHLQLAIPAGGENAARRFYCDLLGLTELPKPESLQLRGGLWLRCGDTQLHLGIDPDFRAAKKAHPGFTVRDIEYLINALRAAGHEVFKNGDIPGVERAFTTDPFGNRIELILAQTGD